MGVHFHAQCLPLLTLSTYLLILVGVENDVRVSAEEAAIVFLLPWDNLQHNKVKRTCKQWAQGRATSGTHFDLWSLIHRLYRTCQKLKCILSYPCPLFGHVLLRWIPPVKLLWTGSGIRTMFPDWLIASQASWKPKLPSSCTSLALTRGIAVMDANSPEVRDEPF